MKIGIVGFSNSGFDQKAARKWLEQALSNWVNDEKISDYEIVSGLTNVGVPKIAYEIAVEQGIKTVGISAQKALEVKCGVFPCDKQIIIGKEFGDESDVFIDYIDVLVRVGGGTQSRKEVQMFKDKVALEKGDISKCLIEHEVE
ncbi:hypothetical protein [Pleionea sp. CnH1-48]|uniref:hypothetical protein n=1 Tax=Pleionea sp. CnH1-48 TaxID=2954494 RepID=UPI002097FDC9|nr:hypothetical protein [Pleionea sp. CnH1-48]MCO7226807.1 hypothetical protein [Pleionea sp. CnH1-48]